MSRCKYCGAEIEWIETKAGKNMPVEPESVEWGDHEWGDILVSELGDVAYTDKEVVDPHPNLTWYVCHFSACVRSDGKAERRDAIEKLRKIKG